MYLYSFFHISVLASLWRIISGEKLKMGDAKLENLVSMIQTVIKEFGHPLTGVSMNYTWLYKLINHLGIIKAIPYMQNMLNFTGSVLVEHKKRHVDGT